MTRVSAGKNERLILIDYIRLAGVIIVLLRHQISYHAFAGEPTEGWHRFITHNGENALTMFFFVSGLMIARNIVRRDGSLVDIKVGNFYVFRAARVLPLLLGVLSIEILLDCLPYFQSYPMATEFLGDPNSPVRFIRWLAIATFTNNWFLALSTTAQLGLCLNVFWTLSIEEQFYLFLPVLSRRAKSLKVLTCGLIILAIIAPALNLAFMNNMPGPNSMCNSLRGLGPLMLGILLQIVWHRHEPTLSKKPLLCWSLVGAGAFIFFVVVHKMAIPLIPTAVSLALFLSLLGALNLRLSRRPCPRSSALAGNYVMERICFIHSYCF